MPSSATITSFFTFLEGTKARASQVNTNFQNFRGHSLPTNTDTITASDNTHDLGASDHRWRSLYLVNPPTIPTVTASKFWGSPASGNGDVPSFRAIAPTDLLINSLLANRCMNVGITATVGSSALTIALKQNDASTDAAAASGAVRFAFRNATGATGSYTVLNLTTSLSTVVPSGATLGHASGLPQYVWVYILNNAGALELGVSGAKLFDENSVAATTIIDTNSDSGQVLYSGTGATCPIILIGRILVTQATAGTWASAVTEIALVSGKQPITYTEWTAWTPTGSWATGANTTYTGLKRRLGGDVTYQIYVAVTGTPTSATLTLSLPSGEVIDTTRLLNPVQYFSPVFGSVAANRGAGGIVLGVKYYSTTQVVLDWQNSVTTASGALVTQAAPVTWASGDAIVVEFTVPIVGFSRNSP